MLLKMSSDYYVLDRFHVLRCNGCLVLKTFLANPTPLQSALYIYSTHPSDGSDKWIPILEVSSQQPEVRINLNDLKPSTEYQFRVRAVNAHGISPPSPASNVYKTPASRGFSRINWNQSLM